PTLAGWLVGSLGWRATFGTFAHLPGLDRAGARSSRLSQALMRTHVVQRLGKGATGAVVRGPGLTARSRSWVEVSAEATDDCGRSVSAALIDPGTYDLAADSVLGAVNALQTDPP
ncbi:hypothetical protein LZ318_00925, partial [Saccharopolyspora indica]